MSHSTLFGDYAAAAIESGFCKIVLITHGKHAPIADLIVATSKCPKREKG